MTRITLAHELGGHRDGDTIDVSPGVAALLRSQGYTTTGDAGDQPDGGDDLTSSSGTSGVTRPPQSGKGSGEKAWALYAESLGLEVPEAASRDDIVALVDAHAGPTGGDDDED